MSDHGLSDEQVRVLFDRITAEFDENHPEDLADELDGHDDSLDTDLADSEVTRDCGQGGVSAEALRMPTSKTTYEQRMDRFGRVVAWVASLTVVACVVGEIYDAIGY
jgi:hypothetical protein